ncbi:MAG: hypothetical protein ACRCWG_01610 [Sarcina sp.]
MPMNLNLINVRTGKAFILSGINKYKYKCNGRHNYPKNKFCLSEQCIEYCISNCNSHPHGCHIK